MLKRIFTTNPSYRAKKPVDGYTGSSDNFPMLNREEEGRLARSWRDNGDLDAAHTLINSHLLLVCKIARSFDGYGLPSSDLIAEGNVGLIEAVKRFDPERGFRLSTYAMWWIRAAITEYVLSSWSIVKTGTVAARKKLFFGLRSLKNKMQIFHHGELSQKQAEAIAEKMDVPVNEVMSMNRRLSGSDVSLNAPVKSEEATEFIDMLPDEKSDLEDNYIRESEKNYRSGLLQSALESLPERERKILVSRRLCEKAITLEELAKSYNISRERVRQIEANAMRKIRKAILSRHWVRRNQAENIGAASLSLH